MKTTQLPLVKYECDCIGFAPASDGSVILVLDSDGDLGFYDGTVSHADKPYVPLAPEYASRITATINRNIALGVRYAEALRDLSRDLRNAVETI